MKYRNRIRVSRLTSRLANWFKSNIMLCFKSDVPAYIAQDVAKRLHDGEKEINLPMCMGELGKQRYSQLS